MTSESSPYRGVMGPLTDYFPWYAWVVVLLLAAAAALPFFVPPAAGMAVGLSLVEYVAIVAVVEFAAAAGIGALVVHYRNSPGDGTDDEEWRFDP